jgi:uncharacterized protein YcfJ
MRSILLKSVGMFGAMALAVGVSACSGASDTETLTLKDGSRVEVEKSAIKSDLAEERANAAEDRAQAAEAKAAAAEARIACEKDRQQASNRGAIVGGVAGAVVGNQVAGDGAKSEGTAIGGVAGVLAGRQIAKKDHRC